MNNAKVAAKAPLLVKLSAGKTYAWCSCGLSSNQPFCDGSHKGSSFAPLLFQVDETKTYRLCQCKRTRDPGFCDGSHASLKSAISWRKGSFLPTCSTHQPFNNGGIIRRIDHLEIKKSPFNDTSFVGEFDETVLAVRFSDTTIIYSSKGEFGV